MMNAQTGRIMSLAEHVHQSIQNILFTRMGTRVQREEYGSLLPLLLDSPLNDVTLLRCNAAVVMAIAKYEPRYTITHAQTQTTAHGVQISLSGSLNGQAQNFVIGVTHGRD